MDTVHDLGGTQGFGPLPNVSEDDSALFAEEWKARVWALAMMSMDKLSEDQTGWTLDWYRHVLERLPPDLYLRMDYFEKWILGMMTTAVDEGIAEVSEFTAGRADARDFSYGNAAPVETVAGEKPRFGPGDAVVCRRDVGSMHTRMVGYVRGRAGVIESVIGAQALPDEAATGLVRKEQTYVVRFPMAGLWPEAAGSEDSLLIDMWDSYLEPA
uniref:SH3-like domain-containing protein n=1 Tax=Roseovarius indicus TaxID=540747 RepID=UPI003B519B3A